MRFTGGSRWLERSYPVSRGRIAAGSNPFDGDCFGGDRGLLVRVLAGGVVLLPCASQVRNLGRFFSGVGIGSTGGGGVCSAASSQGKGSSKSHGCDEMFHEFTMAHASRVFIITVRVGAGWAISRGKVARLAILI